MIMYDVIQNAMTHDFIYTVTVTRFLRYSDIVKKISDLTGIMIYDSDS
jgi:hypothetical protein